MYNLQHLKQGIRSPNLFAREFNRLYYTWRYGPNCNQSGVDIFQEDWDTLIILDACRYDMFKEENTLSGDLTGKISRGSNTVEFLQGNFDGKTLLDTVYTTANPQLADHRNHIDVTFHDEINVWNSDRWDDQIGTIRPQDLTKAAFETIKKYPQKRHVIHYLQPHYPFITSDVGNDSNDIQEDKRGQYDIWGKRFRGYSEISSEEIWTAYRENLKIALNPVQTLLDKISGKTIVTSDHGNMIGERSSPIPIREWGHPSRTYTEKLVTVPWLVNMTGNRRKIESDQARQTYEIDSSTVNNRLQDLGYV